MNPTHRTTALTLLRAGKSTEEIQSQVPLSVGEIAALAEANHLVLPEDTNDRLRGVDPELVRALAALTAAENSHTSKHRKLAERTRAGLMELLRIQHNAEAVAKAEAEVEDLKRKLAAARNRLHKAKNGTPTASTAVIRAWAKEQGLPVGDGGVLPREIREAWENHNQAATPTLKAG